MNGETINGANAYRLIWAFAAALVGGMLVLAFSGSGLAGLIAALAGVVAATVARIRAETDPIEIAPSPPAAPLAPETAAVIEGVSEPILICTGNRVSLCNEAARRLLGAHIADSDVRLAIRHPAAADRLTGPIVADAPPLELAGLGSRDQRWELHVSPLGREGRIIHLTDRSGARAAERMRVDFVANASHELRTPLAAILGFVETLSDPDAGGDPDTRSRFLGIIDKEARRMQRLIDELMALSRIEAEKHRAPDEAVDLAPLIAETVAVFHASHGARGMDVTTDIAPGVPAVLADRAQISQILHNLVGNSVKYGRAGTPVTVRLKPGPTHMATLTVADEGEGIAPEHLPRLTERFYRVDSGRSRAMGGTGLGLAIVKHIVERHRGRLEIDSETGVGTRISVKLPLAEPAPGQTDTAAPRAMSQN